MANPFTRYTKPSPKSTGRKDQTDSPVTVRPKMADIVAAAHAAPPKIDTLGFPQDPDELIAFLVLGVFTAQQIRALPTMVTQYKAARAQIEGAPGLKEVANTMDRVLPYMETAYEQFKDAVNNPFGN